MFSNDGLSWQSGRSGGTYLTSVAWGRGRFVAVGRECRQRRGADAKTLRDPANDLFRVLTGQSARDRLVGNAWGDIGSEGVEVDVEVNLVDPLP